MSDLLRKSAFLRFKECLSVSINNSLKYVKDQCFSTEEAVFKLAITCGCLKSWYDIKNKNALANSYIVILNVFLQEKYGMKVNPDCSRIEGRLRRLCSESQGQLRGKHGGTRQKIASTVHLMEFRKTELVDIREVEKELEQLTTEKESLKEENAALHERCDQLYKELLEVESMAKKGEEKLEMACADLESLKKKNFHLFQYLDKIEEQKSFENNGKNFQR